MWVKRPWVVAFAPSFAGAVARLGATTWESVTIVQLAGYQEWFRRIALQEENIT